MAFTILTAGVASCTDGDPGPASAAAEVRGVFVDPDGNPIANSPVAVHVSDVAQTTPLENRTLTTDVNGRFSATFTFPPSTFPVRFLVDARPPLGSGMSVVEADSVASLDPGHSADTLTYQFQAVQVEPPVNTIPPAPFAQGALLGRYWGQSVQPLRSSVIVYLDLNITGTVGSVSGQYDIDFNASFAVPDGTVLGAVLLDTLRLQLTSDSIPGFERNIASFKAIATSSSADTLIATPDPCTGPGCWLFTAPLRLIRTP